MFSHYVEVLYQIIRFNHDLVIMFNLIVVTNCHLSLTIIFCDVK